MWNLLWRKEMLFYYENQPVAVYVSFKGLPQGSALSPFSSILPRQIEFCRLLQYADDLAVYAFHVDVENVTRTVESACAGFD
jgi:hypothetical protein